MQHDTVLIGYGIRLEPVDVSHASELASLLDDEMWAGMALARPKTGDEYAAYIASQQAAPGTLAFTVVDDRSGQLLGSTSLYELVPSQQRVEIGSTWYRRPSWGGRTNPAAKRLLFGHAFGSLDLHRVALRCDARNSRSAAAILRLGATAEGILREHRVSADGSRADTAYFSVLRPEWPAVRDALDARLD